MKLLLIPLDEAIVFPSVTATLPIDPGEEERVFLLWSAVVGIMVFMRGDKAPSAAAPGAPVAT